MVRNKIPIVGKNFSNGGKIPYETACEKCHNAIQNAKRNMLYINNICKMAFFIEKIID